MTLITSGAETISPTAVSGLERRRESGNIVHRILGRSEPDITLRPALLPTGTFSLRFRDEDMAAEAVSILGSAGVCTLIVPERPTLNGMTFVIAGEISDPWPDAGAWTVTAGYQEVSS